MVGKCTVGEFAEKLDNEIIDFESLLGAWQTNYDELIVQVKKNDQLRSVASEAQLRDDGDSWVNLEANLRDTSKQFELLQKQVETSKTYHFEKTERLTDAIVEHNDKIIATKVTLEKLQERVDDLLQTKSQMNRCGSGKSHFTDRRGYLFVLIGLSLCLSTLLLWNIIAKSQRQGAVGSSAASSITNVTGL
jgi:hypothetical protein